MYSQNLNAFWEAFICQDFFLVRRVCFELRLVQEVTVSHQSDVLQSTYLLCSVSWHLCKS